MGLLEGLKMILSRISRAGGLSDSWTAKDAAVWIWFLVHPVQWRLLVVENGWSSTEFATRKPMAARSVLAS